MNLKNIPNEAIGVNIWDDYHDDDFVPEGETQETYAYIEDRHSTDEDQHAVLLKLQQTIESLRITESTLICSMKWYDSALVYPNLVGTAYERCLYKRWQLQMKHLPHSEREYIVKSLSHTQLNYNGRPLKVYSES